MMHDKMSILTTSNYKSTIKSSKSTKTSSLSSSSAKSTCVRVARLPSSNKQMAVLKKFLLINLIILLQTLAFSKASTVTTTTAAAELPSNTTKTVTITTQYEQQPEQNVHTNPLSMLTTSNDIAASRHSTPSIDASENDEQLSTRNTAATSTEIKLNGVNAANIESKTEEHHDLTETEQHDGGGIENGDNADSDNLFFNQIISNLTLLSDAGHEYDASTVSMLGNVTHSCLQKCVEEESIFINDFGVKCSTGDNRTECYRSRCFKGCELWWNALKEFEPCQEACSSSQFYPFDLPCISACEQTQRRYWHLQRLRLEQWVLKLQPQLLHEHDSINSPTLKWPISLDVLPAHYLASRPFNIQYQYAREKVTKDKGNNDNDDDNNDSSLTEQDVDNNKQWWNLADYNCNENFECDIIDGLMPFTEYRFRFELPFGENFEDVLYTPASEIYKTPAMGRPLSQPIITQAIAVDDSHVAIFWKPGKFINGPLKNYELKIENQDKTYEIEKSLPANTTHFIFPELLPSTLYAIQILMINLEGAGPPAFVNVTTKQNTLLPLKLDDFNSLIMAGEYSLILKSLDPLMETKTLYKSEELLSDFDVYQTGKRVFVVDNKGNLKSFPIENPLDYSSLDLLEASEGFVPVKLSVDWLNQKLFIAGQTLSKAWQILTTDFKGSSLEVLNDNFPEPVQQLQVDSLNGWLFATTTEGLLYQIDLSSKMFKAINPHTKIHHFVNDFRSYLLKSYDPQERLIQELSYDGEYAKNLTLTLSPLFKGDILSFNFVQEQILLASNGSHLLRQNFLNNEIEILSIRDIELCWKLLPLMSPPLSKVLQPLPQPLKEPESLQAKLSDTKAHISWQAPAIVQQFQSLACWQRWEYELEIMDVSSNSAFNIRNIQSLHFQVERLQANNLYKIKVRARFAQTSRLNSQIEPSEWSQELTTRTWPMAEHRLLWSASKGFIETDELAENSKLIAVNMKNTSSAVQVNSSLYFISEPGRKLKCINLMNTEISCGFHASNAYSVDYDWRGGRLYWSDIHRNFVIRSDLKGENRELLPIFEARHIRVDSLKGFLYFCTDTRLLRQQLSGSLVGQQLEYYHVNGNGEKILGFTLDLLANHIYWFVQHQEDAVKLFRSDMDEEKSELVLELPKQTTVVIDSLQYLQEIDGFMWLDQKQRSAVIVRKEQLQEMSVIASPSDSDVNYVRLYLDFQPFMDESVIPSPVDKESILVTEGYWDDFNVKWTAVSNPHNHTQFYKVLITSTDMESPNQLLSFEVTQPVVRITEFKMAAHNINVTITPCTLWSCGSPTFIQLRTPSAAPKQPKNLRVFVEQLQEPLQDEANITALLRWDSPDNISLEKEVFYKVYCWLQDELHSVKDIDDMGLRSHEVRFYNLKKEQSYTFQVQAFSLTRSQGGEKTSLLTHFINPEVQSRPKLIFTTSEYIGELDMDLNTTKVWVYTSSEVEHLVIMPGEQRLIWVNENVELMTYQPGSPALKLARMRAEVLSMSVDWIQRKVYWAELSGDIEHAVDLYVLDLNQYEGKVMMGLKLFSLNHGKLLKNLIVLPYARNIMWLEYDVDTKNATLQGRNLNNLTELKFKSLPPLTTMFDGSWLQDMESVNIMDTKGKLYAYEIQRHLLTSMKIALNPSEHYKAFERDAGYFYALTNRSVQAYNRRKHNLEYSVNIPDIKLIKAFNHQEYPKRNCLILEKPEESDLESEEEEELSEIFVSELTDHTVTFKLSGSNPMEKTCKLFIPGLKYRLIMKDPSGFEKSLQPQIGTFNVTHLRPYTNYSVLIQAASYYQQKLLLPEMQFPEFSIITREGSPSQPVNFTVLPASPSEILVTWQEPEYTNAESVSYELYWQLDNATLSSRKIVEGFEVSLVNLEPDQDYTVWLEVFSKPSKLNRTDKITVTTYPEPEHLRLSDKQAYNLTLNYPTNAPYEMVFLECLPHSQDPEDTAFSIDITGIDSNITVVNLKPKTKYEFYLKLQYPNINTPYTWPELQTSHYIYETLGDAPGRPGTPQIEHIAGEIFKVFWQPAENNGANIVEYSLEALQARMHKRIRRNTQNSANHTSGISMLAQLPWVEELQPVEDKWVVYCNTSELSCIVRELHTMRLLMFRVRARNEPYGWGPYSEDSERVLEPFVSPQKRNSLVLAIIAPAAIVTTCVILLIIVRKVHKRRLKAKQLLAKSRPSIWSNVSNMQQQQQIASRHRAFSINSSATMYTGGPLSDADIALLPHINWSQITLLNFLGSGAFGEVYEGLIKHEDEEEPEKVAIKSLRKGASEFAELLQEAQLMSNFKHENIVRLIGVCCETESISIIMEHMEGGDLLSYLRESRPNSSRALPSLQLLDLLSMCIDVATGMAYLEDMHFVHRDLACRNCLVSSRIPSKRTVKIGDFGLARDIYKSDYYRKEGEALMPVRWMAPESLVDGVFTTQSDVWAFGVLCWEILTLGQQPYAARNNFEVLNYVKEEGRLEQPENCPDKLYALMSDCWLTEPEERPTFRRIFNTLLAIKTDVRRVSLGDYALYANQYGTVLSSFKSPPLNRVKEKDEENSSFKKEEEEDNITYECKQNVKNEEEIKLNGKESGEKFDLKVRFENTNGNVNKKQAADRDSLTDETHLIDSKLYRIQENPDYYVNEGISRL